jgi:hypothetical protein
METPPTLKGVFFTQIVPELIPEINMSSLIELGALITHLKKQAIYESLSDSLIKIQWVKFVSLRAQSIENEIENNHKKNYLIFFPLGQIDHSLCITDCILHTKSALDSMAVFLQKYLQLGTSGGDTDIKKETFRKQIQEKNKIIGKKIASLEPWINELQSIRDEWIHRTSYKSLIIQEPQEVGYFPIPRKSELIGNIIPDGIEINRTNFYSSQDFLVRHYMKLIMLFQTIKDVCISEEYQNLKGELYIPKVDVKEMIFLIRTQKAMTPDGIITSIVTPEQYFSHTRGKRFDLRDKTK